MKRRVRDGPGSDDRGVVELREIEVFLALAEELHFGRTAQRLRLSPGRVSQMIRALEREIGGSLFERSSRQVRLTRLGGRFRTGAELIHSDVEDTLRACRALVSDTGWRLHIGYSASIGLEFVAKLVAAFESAYPGSIIVFNSLGVRVANPVESLLLDPTRDLALMWCPGGDGGVLSSPMLTVGAAIDEDPRALLVPTDHPLADREAVGLDELVGYQLLEPGLSMVPAMREAWAPHVTPSGRRLEYTADDLASLIGRPEVNVTDIYPLVLAGRGLHLTVKSVLDRLPCPGLVAVRIIDMPPAALVPVWRRSADNDGIHAFVEIARSLL